MRCLLDTHALLWSLDDISRFSARALDACLAPAVELHVSAASYWEICLKISVGKLALPSGWRRTLDRHMTANAMRWLPITKDHCARLIDLPWHHRDPFDRLLVCQALHEGLTIVTADQHVAAYGVRTLW